jgi:DNA-binding protein HU-beta
MTKQEIVNEIAKKTGFDKVVISKTVESLMDTINTSMTNNKNIYLRGFGTFEVKKRAKKIGRNITKKTTVIIPEHFAPAFRPCKEFVDTMKSKKVK